MSNPHDGHRNRMRQRIAAEGLRSLAPHEVLEYFLYAFVPRRNTNDIAHRLLARFHSLSGVLDADYNALLDVEGVTANAALFLTNLPALAILYKQDKMRADGIFIFPGSAAYYFNELIGYSPVEELAALCLDVKGKLLSTVRFSVDDIRSVPLDMRKLVKELLDVRACGVIVAHNHPSGDVTPSAADYAVLHNLQTALAPLHITVLDCLVVGCGNAFSMMQTDSNAPDLHFAETAASAMGEGHPVDAGTPIDDETEYRLLFNRNDIPKQ